MTPPQPEHDSAHCLLGNTEGRRDISLQFAVSRALPDLGRGLRGYLAVPSVATLLRACRPPAIAGFVVPFDIDTVDCGSVGTLAHIGEEVDEVVAPTAAYTDASTAVVLERRIIGVRAARDHRGPCLVRATLVEPMPSADASATSGVPTEQVVIADCHVTSANTAADPSAMTSRFGVCAGDDSQSTKRTSGVYGVHRLHMRMHIAAVSTPFSQREQET